MTINEARAQFPIGSRVRVMDTGKTYSTYNTWAEDHFSKENYEAYKYRTNTCRWVENGEEGTVVAIDSHGGAWSFDVVVAGVIVDNKGPIIISVDALEIVDSSKITKEAEDGSHYQVSFDGTSLFVTAYGVTVEHNVEELLSEIQEKCYKKSREFAVGDSIRITDNLESYSTFDKWLKRNVDFDKALRFDWGNDPERGSCGMIVAKAEHSDKEPRMLYLVKIYDGSVCGNEDSYHLYLMDENGIEKI